MSSKTRRILFFLTITIFAFANTSQARYLLVEVVGEPKIDDILPRVVPVTLTTYIPESHDGSTTTELTITSSDTDGGTGGPTTPEFKTSIPIPESESDEFEIDEHVKYDDAVKEMWCKDSKPIEGRNGCMSDKHCLENARGQCDKNPTCFGVSWFPHIKHQKLKLCTSREMVPKRRPFLWRTMMKIEENAGTDVITMNVLGVTNKPEGTTFHGTGITHKPKGTTFHGLGITQQPKGTTITDLY